MDPAASAWTWQPGESERLALLPIRHESIWAFRKKLEGLHWTAQEVDMSRDAADWKRLSAPERALVTHVLSFFARVDIDVLGNLEDGIGPLVDCLEAQFVYAAQKDQECVHSEVYALSIETLLGPGEREAALRAVVASPSVRRMREWALAAFAGAGAGRRLAAAALVEGVMFSASFAILQWLRSRDLLPGLTVANEYIARDEGVHTLFSCHLFARWLAPAARPGRAEVRAMLDSLLPLLDDFVAEGMPAPISGLSPAELRAYTHYTARAVYADLGFDDLPLGANPLPMMETMCLNSVGKANFFERRGAAYQRPATAGASDLAVDDTPFSDD